MKNSKTLFQDFVSKITLTENDDELRSIGYLTFENVFGLSRADIFSEKKIQDSTLVNKLETILERINNHEPIQYVLGESWFYERSFVVNPSVLIPRPETGELVRVVLEFVHQTKKQNCRIIDIGTGSGCIAVTLSLELPHADIVAVDVSDDALRVAALNADRLKAKVSFKNLDILANSLLSPADIIVSNPPYIAWSEYDGMSKNVVDYEPHSALFVDSKDPLLFYKAIIRCSKESLRANGLLAVEINERFGTEVYQLFVENNFRHVTLIKDMFGKDRMVKGISS
jgi:release factor glutamine methyltransferase